MAIESSTTAEIQDEINEVNQKKLQIETPTAHPLVANGEFQEEIKSDELMVDLSKYILLLAMLVATVTYVAGFSPPGGVWEKTDDKAGQLAGDSILRVTSRIRYLVFFYCNAAAFASSLVIIVLAFLHEEKKFKMRFQLLRLVMVFDLLGISGAYAAGTCRDTATTVYSLILVTIVFIYLVVQIKLAWQQEAVVPNSAVAESGASSSSSAGDATDEDKDSEKRVRKVLMLLATFAVSVTYVAGMSTPGGFWDDTVDGDHRAGNAILKNHHGARLAVFLCFNTTSFVASLLIIVVLLERKYRAKYAYWFITVAMISLFGAYATGSSRKIKITFFVICLVVAVLGLIAFLYVSIDYIMKSSFCTKIKELLNSVCTRFTNATRGPQTTEGRKAAEKARSLVLLLATLAATITYQAGLVPPGGFWPDKGDGYMAGDPILLTTNPRRYKTFFYCNSVAFVASLVAIILVQMELLLKNHVLEAVMILDLFGLIGAYAAGSCRGLSNSIYAMALAGAVLVYVVIHVVFYFTLDHVDNGGGTDDDELKLVDKRRKRLLLFAVLAATITYQAGLTPPGGFLSESNESKGFHVGDPVLFHNFPRRYTAFFYCNSVSFMLSMALIILLVNPHLYRPAIRSYALAVCTAAGMFGLIGAYSAGSTQHIKTSTYIFALVFAVLLVIPVLLVSTKKGIVEEEDRSNRPDQDQRKKIHSKCKYLMLLGILVASVTYQAGLDPPGGAWQESNGWYDAGNPVMHDNRRSRYLAFFYSNSTSFVASIVVIIVLLPNLLLGDKTSLRVMNKTIVLDGKTSLRVMNTTIVLDLLALLGAYAAGSSRGWKTCLCVFALIIAVMTYIGFHLILAMAFLRSHGSSTGGGAQDTPSQARVENQP